MIITVMPTPDFLQWGVYISAGDSTVLFGVSKASCDADFCAWQLQKMFEDEKPEVQNYPDVRLEMCEKVERARKEAKNTTRSKKVPVE